jgi:tetratricopeptide (TPR) repeat protein/putative NADH-flavin reductase
MSVRESPLAAKPGSPVAVWVNPAEQRLAREAGLGALSLRLGLAAGAMTAKIELAVETLAGGLAALKADFNLLLGDLVWKCEMHRQSLTELLQEIRLAEFEREARAYRLRAERAYLNGWYEEALADFLEAARRNYPDYAVHRSIGHIYFYHLPDLPKALEAFRKAAKYAEPGDPKQAAEAHYFAASTCALQQQPEAALAHFAQAAQLDPELAEAHYQRACLAATLDRREEAIASLTRAIEGDARYFERAKNEAAFRPIRSEIHDLLDRLMAPVRAKVLEVKQDAAGLRGYVIAQPVEEKIAGAFHLVERQMADSPTYRTGLQLLDTLSQIQQEMRGLRNQYFKQYEIDPRDYVRAVAFSNDGRLLAAGFLHGTLQVWEAGSGRKLHANTAHGASVVSVAFSPNHLWLASGSRDNTIKLWEADTGAELQTLRGHKAEVSAVAFSPDGQWLVSGSHDRTIKRWRVVTGREAETLAGHDLQVTAALFTPDGQTIVSASWDRTIRLWNVASGRTLRTLTGHTKGVASLAVSPDGRLLASGGEDARVKLWDLKTGEELQSFNEHGNSVTSVAFSPDGQLLAAGCLGRIVVVWQLDTGEAVKRLRYDNISYNSVAFSPQGQWLALGSRDLQLWLKAILSIEEYETVRRAEARSLPVYVPIQAR